MFSSMAKGLSAKSVYINRQNIEVKFLCRKTSGEVNCSKAFSHAKDEVSLNATAAQIKFPFGVNITGVLISP